MLCNDMKYTMIHDKYTNIHYTFSNYLEFELHMHASYSLIPIFATPQYLKKGQSTSTSILYHIG